MDTSAAAAGEGSSFTFRVKQEPGQGQESAAPPPEDDSRRAIRKVTVLDPLKLKLLSRQNHNMLLSGLNAAKAKAKPPAPTPPPTVPAPTAASTTPVTATEGEPTNTTKAEPEPSSAAAEPLTEAVVTKLPPPAPAVVKAPQAGGGSTLFRRKKVVPAVIAKKIAQKEKAKPAALQPEPTKEAVPAKPPPVIADVPPQQPTRVKPETPAQPAATPPAQVEEETTSNEVEPAATASVTVKEEKEEAKAVRPTAFRRIKPKVAICLNPSRPKKSILKKNTSAEQLSPGKSAAKDLIPEETIVLEEDDEDREEEQRIEQKQAEQHEEEQRRVREEDERRKEHAEEERKAVEAKRRMEEEERKMAEERRRIEEEERKKVEERRRIEVEERQKAEEKRRIEEEERNKAEERRRIVEEEKKKAEEQRRIEEEERKKAEERRGIVEEEKKKVEERLRIEEEKKKKDEERQRIEEEERKKAEEKAKTEAENRSKVELIRKSRKIPAEVWKLQMEKMRSNPNRLHNAVVSSESPPVVAKDAVTVEKSDVTVCRESPVVAQQKPEHVVQSAEQRTPNPTKEIRRICPLPPSVARQLMNSVGLNSAMKKPPQDPVKPDTPKIVESTPVVAAESSRPASVPVVPQTKAIRRISRLPPNLASVIVSAVRQSTTQDNSVDKVEQRLPVVVPEKAPIEVKRTEETDSTERPVISVAQHVPAPPPTKAIKRIARLPPDIAKRLLSSVNQKKAIAESPKTIKVEPPKEVTETALPVTVVEPVAHSVPAVSPQVPQDSGSPVQTLQEPTPQKEIRRISQLPRNVAMKLVDSLKQKGIAVPKLVLKKEAPGVPEVKSATVENQVLREPTTPSSTAVVPEIKIEPQEPPLTKTRRKVEILSQVILPTASYNLEELLAGKSTEGFNTGPSGSMPLPLPMPRTRRPTTIVPPPAPISAPIHDLPMIDDPIMKDDVASEVTVTTEKDEVTDSAHEMSDEYIVPECEIPSEDIPVQYNPPPKNIPPRQEPRHQSNQQTVFPRVQVPTAQQYPASYAASSSQPIYSRTVQAPVIQQPTTSIPSGQPSITYYAKIPSSSSETTTAPYRPHIIISRPMHPPRMVAQRMVLNPASAQQHPGIQGQRPRFSQYVLVRQPAPVRGRHVPQIQPQLPPQHQQQQQQQSRQHLMVPKATYYQRYPPAEGQNQHQVIYPTPRFMIPPQQSQHHPQPQPTQQQRPQLNYVVPTISSQSKAFRPVEPAQSSHSPPKPHVIPRIVIDSSYVEQQDRSVGTPPSTEQPHPFQNHSPCSEEIRNKLRDKLRARMLRQNSQPESPLSETPPSTPLPPPPPVHTPSQPSVPSKLEHRTTIIPPRPAKVYHPQDFQQTRTLHPPHKPTADNRVIKQYICQGRKIYLTKISVTKPVLPHATQSSRAPAHQVMQQYQLEAGFHGFPQTAIRHDQRIFQQFSETVQQLERKISPEPPEEGQQHVPNMRMKSRKPSVVTAVTTGLEGETFIITELIDTPEVAQEVQVIKVKKEVPIKHPPRITKRRKTFVVDDSDVEMRVEQLPRVETTSQEESQGEEKIPEVKVKVEDEARGKSPERRSAFERRVKEEEFSDTDTSLADEDLARDILALVENERKSLRFDRPAKKVKKRIKRRKRRKKKKNGNVALMDLLMKHVNQESLIADIVAARQKQLPVVEISDTDEDEREMQRQSHVVHVKKDPDAVEPTESEVEIESDSSETDIFAEILKPFVEEDHQPEEEKIKSTNVGAEEPQQEEILDTASVEAEEPQEKEKAQTACDVFAETHEGGKEETVSDAAEKPQEGESKQEEEKASDMADEQQKVHSRTEEEQATTVSAVAEEPLEEDSKQEAEKIETANVVTVEPQEQENRQETDIVETASTVIEEPQEEEIVETVSKHELQQTVITSAVTPEPLQEEQVEPAPAAAEAPQKNDPPVEEQSVDMPTKVTNEPEIPEISAELATDSNPVSELTTQPATKCDQICDTSSALPVEKPKKPKKAPAPRAPKRKLKPTLVSRPKVRKVEPPPPPPINIAALQGAVDDEIEDYSDPFSDRDESLPAASVEESELQEVGANETLDAIKPPSVRELVDEWDSDEASRDVVRSTMIRPFGKHVSFDNNGNVPCRISKNNALKRAAMLNDTVEEVPPIETRIEESVQKTEEAPVSVPTEVKSVRVSVLKMDLVEREKAPDPEVVQMEEPAATENAPTRVESTEQSVRNLLKDWDESPVKQLTGKPHVVPRVLLDRINSSELTSLRKIDKPQDVSTEGQSSVVLENIALTDQNRWDEPSASEPERIISRIIYDKELYQKLHGVPKESSIEPADSTSNAAVTQDSPSRQTRSHKKLDVVPSVIESPTTRSNIPKQTTIKAWLSSTTNDSPPKEPVIEQQKPVPKARKSARDRAAEISAETQKPAGRTLRSRAKSMFAEKAPELAEKLAPPEAESTETRVEEQPPSESRPEVMEEAGGSATCTARKAEEQESKECSSITKPVPIVRNRIPIQISSEDEDDAPLAKRRKVLRKRRYMMRQRDRVRDLSDNKRLFRGGGAHRGTLIADGNYLGETAFIKTEPPDVMDTPEYYPPAPQESFTVITPEANSERLLSVVTVQNNQIVHAQDYETETPPRKQYFSKDLVQPTDPTATSTPIHASAPVPAEEHVFATPEPVRANKRKRRTKQEMEADRYAKPQRSVEELTQPESAKPRAKREIKSYVPIDAETVDPTIREFQCAACSEMVARDKWDVHYAKHSGLTYRVDVDPVVDIQDETTATAIVTRFMKVHRQVTIYCDKCNVAKKSALGLVSHRMICGMTKQEIEASKVTCEHCNRKLMAVSMNSHLASHCQVLKKKRMEQSLDLARLKTEEADSSQADPTATLTQRGTIKRKATAKAEKRIQNISFSELIVSVSKDKVTEGCMAIWKTQLRKAKTALCVFQTCNFTGNDEMEMRHHHEFCPSPCELFECKNCRFQTDKIEQMAKHIKLRHSALLSSITLGDSSGTDAKMTSESSDDEGTSGVDENEEPFSGAGDDDDDERPKKSKRKSLSSLLKTTCNRWGNTTRDQFNEESDVYREMILDELIELRSSKNDFHLTAREWTAEFRKLNYSRKILFADLRPDLDVRFLTFNMVQDYIPKSARSLRFMVRSTNLYNAPVLAQEYNDKWQHLEAFSGQVNDKESLFYCGGPIVALDWLPVPDSKDEHQILAVACKKDFDEFYLADRIYPTKCLIQIWDVGYLSNNNLYNKKVENSAPALLYSIACDFGPIWSLKFCPSGCYNFKDGPDQYDRLGLLAAAGSDGNVHIFSLGRNYEHLISNSYRVVNLTPVLKLTLSLEVDSSCSAYECHSAVKLSWSKSKNHAMIAAGYSNGAVAVWNLNTTSPLLTGTKEGVRALLPVHKAFIPDSCITAVDLHYSDEARYLLVCNADRRVVVYDLNTGYLPMEVCSMNARSKVTTACWNTHFPLITMAFDDVYAIDRCALTFHQTREIGVRLHPLYTFTAEATDMSASDHLSTHVIGTDGGDVLSHQPMAFVHQMGQKNTHQMKYILTSTISVKVNDDLTDNSYGMFHKNYGVLFSDSDKNSRMDLRSLQVKSFRRALLHEYPGIRVNQVRWNPNEKSHQYYAIGYQAGFVRVRAFRFK